MKTLFSQTDIAQPRISVHDVTEILFEKEHNNEYEFTTICLVIKHGNGQQFNLQCFLSNRDVNLVELNPNTTTPNV